MKKFMSMLLCGLMAFSMVACGGNSGNSNSSNSETGTAHEIVIKTEDFASFSGEKIDAIKKKGELVVATEAQYAPFEFMDAKGNYLGCDIWLAEQIAAALGVKLKIVDMDFKGIVPGIQAGESDLGIAAITYTAERAKSVDFSKAYIESPQKLVVAKGHEADYKTIEDLAGKTVGSQMGTVQSELIKGVLTDSTPFELDKWPSVAMEVASGKIDALLTDAAAADNMVAGNDQLAIADLEFTKEQMNAGEAVIMQKGSDDLMELVNAVIEAVEGDKGFNAAYEKAKNQSSELGL